VRLLRKLLKRQIAKCLVFLLAMPLAEVAQALPRQESSSQQTQSTTDEQGRPQDPANAAASQQSQPGQPSADQQQNSPTKPVGTAVAPVERTTGVAASRPAGAVIAPAKQRRARSILIRVSIVIGAAVAVGTVVALSRASPNRPN
jgi:hypothetical protein